MQKKFFACVWHSQQGPKNSPSFAFIDLCTSPLPPLHSADPNLNVGVWLLNFFTRPWKRRILKVKSSLGTETSDLECWDRRDWNLIWIQSRIQPNAHSRWWSSVWNALKPHIHTPTPSIKKTHFLRTSLIPRAGIIIHRSSLESRPLFIQDFHLRRQFGIHGARARLFACPAFESHNFGCKQPATRLIHFKQSAIYHGSYAAAGRGWFEDGEWCCVFRGIYCNMRNWGLQCIECSKTVCNRVIGRNIS